MSKRQEEIVEKALELIVAEGITGLTMKKVAERMGFTEPAMYRHFRDKQDLVVALVERIEKRYEALIEEIDHSLPPEQFLPEFLCPLLEYLEQVRGVTMLFLSESTYNRENRIRQSLYSFYTGMVSRLADYFQEQQAYHRVRKDVDPVAAAILLMGAVQSLTIRYILSGERLRLKDKCLEIIDIFLKGVIA